MSDFWTVRKRLLRGKDSRRLLVFFTGWGFDERPFEELAARSPFDTLVIYDYRHHESLSLPDSYGEYLFLAWSLGGAVALKLGAYLRGPLFVLGATGCFCDEELGIPPRVFNLTLKGLRERGRESLESFYRRAFYGEPGFELFERRQPVRPLAELVEELEKTRSLAVPPPPPEAPVKILITGKDRIVPPQAQRRYWGMRRVKERPFGHFPFYRFQDFLELLSEFS